MDHEVRVCSGLTRVFVIGDQFVSFPLEPDESSLIIVQERPSKGGIAVGPIVADSIFLKEIHHTLHESDPVHRVEVHQHILGFVTSVDSRIDVR